MIEFLKIIKIKFNVVSILNSIWKGKDRNTSPIT